MFSRRSVALASAIILNACADDAPGGLDAAIVLDVGTVDGGPDASSISDTGALDVAVDGGVEDIGDAGQGDDGGGPTLGSPIMIPLGTMNSGDTIEFDVPENAVGFHIVVSSASTGDVGIQSLVSPAGLSVLRQFAHDGAPFALARAPIGVASTQVPQANLGSTTPLEVGTWSMVPRSFPDGPIEVTVYVQTGRDGTFNGGQLDVVVYLPSGIEIADPGPVRVVDAASAPRDEAVQARLDSFFDALHELSEIDRGEVRFVDVDASFRAIDDGLNILEAGALAMGSPESPAAHFVWTESLVLQGTEIWGSSPGAPGIIVQTGTSGSALLVDVTLGFPAVADGFTMLHELGHFAGLLHTSFPGGVGDLLDDTPVCPDLELGFVDRTCPDRTNLMFPAFWGATGGEGIVLSDEQVRVLHGTPIYRPYL